MLLLIIQLHRILLYTIRFIHFQRYKKKITPDNNFDNNELNLAIKSRIFSIYSYHTVGTKEGGIKKKKNEGEIVTLSPFSPTVFRS